MTEPTDPPSTEPERVVVLTFADSLPAGFVADVLGELPGLLELHGYTAAQHEGNTVTAVPPVDPSGRHRAEEGEVSG